MYVSVFNDIGSDTYRDMVLQNDKYKIVHKRNESA